MELDVESEVAELEAVELGTFEIVGVALGIEELDALEL